VRALFDVFHARSAVRGELMQVISGIPWYYRQFGYEPAVAHEGGRAVSLSEITPLRDGETERFTLRDATDTDLPFLRRAEEAHTAAHLFACVRDDALWQYALVGMRAGAGPQRAFRVIESAEGVAVGYVAHAVRLPKDGTFYATRFALLPGVSWAAVVPGMLRALRATAETHGARGGPTPVRLALELGTEHPAFAVAPRQLPAEIPPYAWYIRVPDVPAFLRHVAPVLERRLATSAVAGHTGELALSFYRTGIRLTLVDGRLTNIAPYIPEARDRFDAGFPDLTFLQLVGGHRTIGELEHAFADVRVRTDEARAVLHALFPRQFSDVWPIS